MKAAAVLIVVLLGVNVWLHTFVSGWGPDSQATSSLARYGVVYNAGDNLTYCALAQQAKSGALTFADLYTTSPHRRLLLNPFFLLIGWLARLFQVHPMLILNLAALACIPLFVGSLTRICRRLCFNTSTTLVVLCLSVGGGGISWIRYVLDKTPLGHHLRVGNMGPDLFYFDIFPATAFSIHPYHAVALALLAVIVSLIVEIETGKGPVSWRLCSLITLAALGLAATRPYEPVLIVASYSVFLILSYIIGATAEVRQRRKVILACLALGTLPLLGYNLWVSLQPVWTNFAAMSLDLHGDLDWAGGLLILWILSAFGLLGSSMSDLRSFRGFFFVWGILCGVLLIVMASGLTKLCGGCTIPLSLAAGVGLQRLRLSVRRGLAGAFVTVGLAFCAMGSPLIAHGQFARSPTRIDADVLSAVAAIEANSSAVPPTVLSDRGTAEFLPGLAGFRVFCGHWSLTDSYSEKSDLLKALGFRTERSQQRSVLPAIDSDVSSQAAALRMQLSSGVYDYLLLKNSQLISHDLLDVAPDCEIYSGTKYRVLKMCPEVRLALEEKLRTIESRAPSG